MDNISDLSNKADSLASKMNAISKKLSDNIDIADELEENGDNVLELVESKKMQIQNIIPVNHIINLDNMVNDFSYVRETLKENTDNARRVLNAIALKLIEEEDEKQAALIISFSELNKAVVYNMKLYISSYREISNILLNIDKIKKEQEKNPDLQKSKKLISVSTTDLIKKLEEKNKNSK